jgi:hypothetical protein
MSRLGNTDPSLKDGDDTMTNRIFGKSYNGDMILAFALFVITVIVVIYTAIYINFYHTNFSDFKTTSMTDWGLFIMETSGHINFIVHGLLIMAIIGGIIAWRSWTADSITKYGLAGMSAILGLVSGILSVITYVRGHNAYLVADVAYNTSVDLERKDISTTLPTAMLYISILGLLLGIGNIIISVYLTLHRRKSSSSS